MLKEIFLAPSIALVALGIWHFTVEKNVRRILRDYLEKKAEREKTIFLDPR